MDVAVAYGDARVYDIVKTKWDSLPPPSDKKKKAAAAARKPGGKRPKSTDPKVCWNIVHQLSSFLSTIK